MQIPVYVGLGGNIGDVYTTQCKALKMIQALPTASDLVISSFYETTPVASNPQRKYLNAVCRFNTTVQPDALFRALELIQLSLGQSLPKPKEAPRILDLDLLFYGQSSFETPRLQIPHPRWRQRLFVLRPLADLTPEIILDGISIDLHAEIANFQNIHGEQVIKINKVTYEQTTACTC